MKQQRQHQTGPHASAVLTCWGAPSPRHTTRAPTQTLPPTMRTLTPRPSVRAPRPRPCPPRSALASPPALHGDALLCTKFPAHAAAVTAVAVVQENGALCEGGN